MTKTSEKVGRAYVGLPPEGTEARRQRDAIDAIKAKRAQREWDEAGGDTITPEDRGEGQEPAAAASPGGGRMFADVRVSNAGGGFVLGAFVYVLGLTYLRTGREGVTAWLKAKFLNEVP